MSIVKRFVKVSYETATHLVGRLTKRYYVEDYVRVYPDQVAFSRLGKRRRAKDDEIRNYLNHCKFYRFAAQFVRDKAVVDVGCGSGYGCAILADAKSSRVCGCDISRQALRFAKRKYSGIAEFTEQGITDMGAYRDGTFDVTISSEVLEHIKEYGLASKAIEELKRVTRPGGIVVIGTPNSELLGNHGFWYDEISELLSSHFKSYVLFENALFPFGDQRSLWEARLANRKTGIVVSQEINLRETVVPRNGQPELKRGINPGHFPFDGIEIDTTLLHNTHSWIAIARP